MNKEYNFSGYDLIITIYNPNFNEVISKYFKKKFAGYYYTGGTRVVEQYNRHMLYYVALELYDLKRSICEKKKITEEDIKEIINTALEAYRNSGGKSDFKNALFNFVKNLKTEYNIDFIEYTKVEFKKITPKILYDNFAIKEKKKVEEEIEEQSDEDYEDNEEQENEQFSWKFFILFMVVGIGMILTIKWMFS